jgi:hypothetical protein
MKQIHKITHNRSLIETGGKLGSVNMIFQLVRKAFNLPEKGKLSENTCDDGFNHENCSIFIGQLKEIIKSGFTHEMDTTKQIISAYKKWEEHLFAQNKEGTIPMTSN